MVIHNCSLLRTLLRRTDGLDISTAGYVFLTSDNESRRGDSQMYVRDLMRAPDLGEIGDVSMRTNSYRKRYLGE